MITKYNTGRFEHVWHFVDASGVSLDIAHSMFATLIWERGNSIPLSVNFVLEQTGTAGELKATMSVDDISTLHGIYDVDILERDQSDNVYFFSRQSFKIEAGVLQPEDAVWQ